MVWFVALLMIALAAAISITVHTLIGAVVLWAVSLFVAGFTWTWLQAFGLGLLVAVISSLLRARAE